MHSKIKGIILDFDGTIFRLFANTNLNNTVIELHNYLSKNNIDFSLENDAFDAFKIAFECNNPNKEEILFEVNKIITNIELEAIDNGILINGFFEFIDYLYNNNLKLIIASNNSKECILKFLSKYNLDKIDIIGRVPNRPDLMKPNTYMLEESIKRLNCNKEEVIFIGDNSRDGECAYKFGCEFIALTPTKSKKERMLNKFPNINLVNDFYELKEFLDNKYI